MEIYSILDCFAIARNDGLSSRVSETNVAIQIEIKKGMYIILDCFAIARNDGLNIKTPQSRYARQLP